MSTTTETPIPYRPAETAPSATVVEAATTARVVGTVGLFFLILGSFAVGAHRIFSTPRMIGEGTGFLFVAFGLTLMLYHAVRDGDLELRRLYGFFAFALIVVAWVAALVPGPVFGKALDAAVGYNLPWGIALALVGLLFLSAFLRHETDEFFSRFGRGLLLGMGVLLTVGMTTAGFFRPGYLAGPGVAVVLLGLGFLCAYLGSVDTTDGPGYFVAFGLGLFGAAVAFAALAVTAFPTVLYDGPQALRQPNGALDRWRVVARLAVIAAFLAPAGIAYVRRAAPWLLAALALFGLAGAGVLIVGSFTKVLTQAPQPFLVPGGVILMGLGLIQLAIALGICSDNPFVTLTRRELGAFFLTPIGYIGLFGMALFAAFGYIVFLGGLPANGTAVPEPIVKDYFFAVITSIFVVLFLVPALTMRLFAEEARTGSLEVLLTAPVNETAVVLSKFVAVWIFYMVAWLPFGLYLVALRIEGGEAFDYRPLLSFYFALGVSGAAFLSMGLFFSSLTRNQVVAAVLTFGGMFFLLLTFRNLLDSLPFLGELMKATLSRLSFYDLWRQALSGQLPLRDVLLQGSVAVFWLFLTVKVLESRRWR